MMKLLLLSTLALATVSCMEQTQPLLGSFVDVGQNPKPNTANSRRPLAKALQYRPKIDTRRLANRRFDGINKKKRLEQPNNKHLIRQEQGPSIQPRQPLPKTNIVARAAFNRQTGAPTPAPTTSAPASPPTSASASTPGGPVTSRSVVPGSSRKLYEIKILPEGKKKLAAEAARFETISVEGDVNLELDYVMQLINEGFFMDDNVSDNGNALEQGFNEGDLKVVQFQLGDEEALAKGKKIADAKNKAS